MTYPDYDEDELDDDLFDEDDLLDDDDTDFADEAEYVGHCIECGVEVYSDEDHEILIDEDNDQEVFLCMDCMEEEEEEDDTDLDDYDV